MNRIKGLIALLLVTTIIFSGCGAAKNVSKETKVKTESSKDGVKLSGDSSDFVVLAEEVPDVILEIRYYSTYNFVGDRIDGYEEPIALITKEAAKALKKASDELKSKGYRLKIYDAYRPQKAVTNFVKWAKDTNDTRMKKNFYPANRLPKSVMAVDFPYLAVPFRWYYLYLHDTK